MDSFNNCKKKKYNARVLMLILFFAILSISLSGCGGGSGGGSSSSSSGSATSYSGSAAPGDQWTFSFDSTNSTFNANDSAPAPAIYSGNYSGTYSSPDQNGFITITSPAGDTPFNSPPNSVLFLGLDMGAAFFIMPEEASPLNNPIIYLGEDGSCPNSLNSTGYDYIAIPGKSWDPTHGAYGFIDGSLNNTEYSLSTTLNAASNPATNPFSLTGLSSGGCSGGIYSGITVTIGANNVPTSLDLNSAGMFVMDLGSGLDKIGGIVGAPIASSAVNFSTAGVSGNYSGFAFGKCATSGGSTVCPFTADGTTYSTIPITANVSGSSGTVECYDPMNPTSQLTFKPNETSCAVIHSFANQVNNSMGVGTIDYFPGSTSAVSENYVATLNEINGKWLIAGLSFTPNGSGGYSYFNFVLVQQ